MHQTAFQFDSDTNLRARTEEWIQANPQVFRLYERFALEMAGAGKRLGMKALTERIRWQVNIETRGDEFKINNNFPSYIARILIQKHPHLERFIECRKVKF